MRIVCGDEAAQVRLEGEEALLGDRRLRFRAHRRGGEIDAIEIEGRLFPLRAIREGGLVHVWCAGRVYEMQKATTAAPREAAGDLVSPMPGRVRKVLVAVGDTIARGQVVLILEAMKMEHAIRAPQDGVVVSIAHNEGELIDAGVKLAEIV